MPIRNRQQLVVREWRSAIDHHPGVHQREVGPAHGRHRQRPVGLGGLRHRPQRVREHVEDGQRPRDPAQGLTWQTRQHYRHVVTTTAARQTPATATGRLERPRSFNTIATYIEDNKTQALPKQQPLGSSQFCSTI